MARLKVFRNVAHPWKTHFGGWHDCTRCEIGEFATRHVFARGVLPCDVLFVGEAPGDTEDMLGYPFLGVAGMVLEEFIQRLSAEWFRGLTSERQVVRVFQPGGINHEALRWAITNTVCCRPANDKGSHFRAPSQKEKANCRPRLEEFVRFIAIPRCIIGLGNHAESALPIDNIPWIKVRHPSSIARNGGFKSEPGKTLFERELEKALTFVREKINS